MVMVAPIPTNTSPPRMTTEHNILILAQWLSPAFPVGAFAYSHGLETAIHSGAIATACDLQDWLTYVLSQGSGRNDCILLRAAYSSGPQAALDDVNQTALAVSASSERIRETQLQGSAFSQTTSAIWGSDKTEFCYPVAVGHAAAQLRLDVDLTAAFYLHGFVSNLVSAAVRAVPLGQTEGQRVLAALIPMCDQIVQDTQCTTLDDLSSTAFLSDIAAMRHETLQPRIFRS